MTCHAHTAHDIETGACTLISCFLGLISRPAWCTEIPAEAPWRLFGGVRRLTMPYAGGVQTVFSRSAFMVCAFSAITGISACWYSR